jgi:hypothetical protein
MLLTTIAAAPLIVLAAFAGDRPEFSAAAQQPAPVVDAETQLWRAARDCAGYQAYLRAYPEGRYKQEALQEIAGHCAAGDRSSSGVENSPAAQGNSIWSQSLNLPTPEREQERRMAAERAEMARQRAMAEAAQARAQAAEEALRQAQASNAGARERPPAKTSPDPDHSLPAGGAAPPAAARPAPKPAGPAPAQTITRRPPVALPAGYEIVSHVLTPTESYLPRRDGMPTGIVLLDVRERAKNQSLCKALLGARTATVKTEAQARRDNPTGDFLVTNWPVTGPVAHEDDCVELLAKYDFDRAARVKGAYALNQSRGPFFLALDPTGEIVFLDLKDASAEEVFKATSDWMKLALASPQNQPAAEQRLGLVAGTNRLFARLAGGFGSLVGANPAPPTLIRFNDPVQGTARQFNIYRAGAYLIGATFRL